jgi:DNA-binding transcriptional ArsR family regulator
MLTDLHADGRLSESLIRHFEITPAPIQSVRNENASLATRLERLIHFRRAREAAFGAELFADPAWDMMLDLCLAAELDRQVSVSSLCIAASVPSTTALRWLGALEEKGLVQREADPVDRRRFFVRLSTEANAALKQLLGHWMGLPESDGSLSSTNAS